MWNKETLYTQIKMHWVWLLGQICERAGLFHKYSVNLLHRDDSQHQNPQLIVTSRP